MFETFSHTADLGLRVRAATREELFAEAARGLFSVLVANPEAVRPVEEIQVQLDAESLDAEDLEFLLFDWLNELLYRFDTEHVLFSQFAVSLADNGLEATCRGEKIDASRHEMDHEVKAITYHGLKVEPTGDGWLAEVIVDI